MNIGLDMMGGDFAPLEAVKGLQRYYAHLSSQTHIYCIGNEAAIEKLLAEHQLTHPSLHIVPATEIIDFHESPTKALKEKPHSSISIGFHLLATNQIDAFISAGNTGAMLVGAMYFLKPIEGLLRPAIATIIPKLNGNTGLLLDVGLNADCKAENLNQFATLGSLYAKNILNIPQPATGMLNVGEEEGKGNMLAQAAYELLKENKHIHFVGNVEGRDLFKDKADVIVCDGFTGNIVLKLAESFYDIAVSRNFHKDEYISRFHYENYGGTPVLGVSKPVVIGHGISNAKAFENMLNLGEKLITTQFCNIITEALHSS